MARFVPAALIACFTALAIPALVVRMPPLLDYPNHLVRMWLIAGGIAEAPLARFYAIDWSLASTNIGIDLLAAFIAPFIGAELLGHFLIAAAVILPVLGTIQLNRALFGGLHWSHIGVTCFAWNLTLLTGLLSFQIGIGLAILAASLDITCRARFRPSVVIAMRISICGALLVFHAFSAAFYATIVAALVFDAPTARPFSQSGRRVWRATLAGIVTLAPPLALFMLLAPVPPGGHAPPGAYDLLAGYTLRNKVATSLSAALTYEPLIDLPLIAAVIEIMALASRRGTLRTHAGLLIAAAGLFGIAIVIPSSLGGTSLIDWRFPIMAL